MLANLPKLAPTPQTHWLGPSEHSDQLGAPHPPYQVDQAKKASNDNLRLSQDCHLTFQMYWGQIYFDDVVIFSEVNTL